MSVQIQQMQRLQLAGTLAGGIAHDLNNELTVVLGHLELAMDHIPSGYDAHDSLELAKNAAGRCADMSRHLLQLGRAKRTAMTTMDVAPVVIQAQQMLEWVKPPNTRMTAESSTGLMIRGDANQLQQALINLGANAFQAMKKGGELKMRAYLENGRVNIAVSDTGCGIPASLHKRIFEPFYTTHAECGNSGLGLTTVRSIMTKHSGVITLESNPGEGSTFLLSFPVCDSV